MKDYEMMYRLQRYGWAKENGLLDELYPVIGHIDDLPTNTH